MMGPSTLTEGLWIAAGTTAVAALALTVAGRRHPAPRGWPLWQAALWLGSTGIVLGAVGMAFGVHVVTLPLAQVLLLQWPILALVGLRRFHARIDWPGRERHDWLLLLASALLVALSAAWPADSAIAAIGAPAGALLVHLYAASLLVCAAARPDDRPMQLLGAVIALAACAPMIATLPGIDPLTPVPNRRHFAELAGKAIGHDAPGSAVTDCDILAGVRMVNGPIVFPMEIMFRRSAAATHQAAGIVCDVSGGVASGQRMWFGPTYDAAAGAADFAWAYDTWYWLRLNVKGSQRRLKIWPRGSAEPASWGLAFVGPGSASGYVGLTQWGSTTTPYAYLDFFSVCTTGRPAWGPLP